MKIKKRLANRLRKHNLANIAAKLNLNSRAVPSAWLARLSIPDKYIEDLERLTGEQIK